MEAAARKLVRSLGTLSPRDEVQAAALVALGRRIDDSDSGSGAAAASRELRQVLADLRDRTPTHTTRAGTGNRLAVLADARAAKLAAAGGSTIGT